MFASAYKPVAFPCNPSVPDYPLPVDPEKVLNFEQVASKLRVGYEGLLLGNGSVVIPWRGDNIATPYVHLTEAEIPVFVTVDTMLHMYHLIFQEVIRELEERTLYPELRDLSLAAQRWLGKQHSRSLGETREAAYKAWSYASIAARLLNPQFAPDRKVKDEVKRVEKLVESHAGFWPSANADRQWPLFSCSEDFSQYVPRGHYARSESLKRYFVGMMWLGRMTFLLNGGEPHGGLSDEFLVSAAEARRQTIAAAMIVKFLEKGKLDDGRSAGALLERVNDTLKFFVGETDDHGFGEYRDALAEAKVAEPRDLLDDGADSRLRASLSKRRRMKIFSGLGRAGARDAASEPTPLLAGEGFRLLGQRYIPDAEIMARLLHPNVGPPRPGAGEFTLAGTEGGAVRGFARGLDVMAALGSQRAREILHELGDDAYGSGSRPDDRRYEDALAEIVREFGSRSEADWNRSLYRSWLWALRSLLEPCGKGYPRFMRTKAWEDRTLAAALASWAQLRHDTILYAKQPYSASVGYMAPPPPPPPPGLLEPAPELYARLLALTRMTARGVEAMGVNSARIRGSLNWISGTLARLLEITKLELENKWLPEAEQKYLRGFGFELERQLEELALGANPDMQSTYEFDDVMKTSVVADVLTESNTQLVVEEATGDLRLLVVCYPLPDGRLMLAAGPVLSYYEFKRPMAQRMTDGEWRSLLREGTTPADPEWMSSHCSPTGGGGIADSFGRVDLDDLDMEDVRIPLEKCASHGREETFRHPACGAPLCTKCVDDNQVCPNCGKDY